jgi:hypothetical protein
MRPADFLAVPPGFRTLRSIAALPLDWFHRCAGATAGLLRGRATMPAGLEAIADEPATDDNRDIFGAGLAHPR